MINRKTVGFAKSREDAYSENMDYEFREACLNPLQRYARGSGEVLPEPKTVLVGIKKAPKCRKARHK